MAPLPPPSDPDCVKKTIRKLRQEGYDQERAVAAAMNHCGKPRSSESLDSKKKRKKKWY